MRLHSEDSLSPHMTTDTLFKIKENTLEMDLDEEHFPTGVNTIPTI